MKNIFVIVKTVRHLEECRDHVTTYKKSKTDVAPKIIEGRVDPAS